MTYLFKNLDLRFISFLGIGPRKICALCANNSFNENLIFTLTAGQRGNYRGYFSVLNLLANALRKETGNTVHVSSHATSLSRSIIKFR